VTDAELAQLQQQATAAAAPCGCTVDLLRAEYSQSDLQLGGERLRVVVMKRNTKGEVLTHEGSLRLERHDIIDAVEQLVRSAAAELARR